MTSLTTVGAQRRDRIGAGPYVGPERYRSCLAGDEQSELGSATRGVAPVAGAELRQHRCDVVFRGARRHDELVGDLYVGASVCEEPEHLELARREVRRVRTRRLPRPARNAEAQ